MQLKHAKLMQGCDTTLAGVNFFFSWWEEYSDFLHKWAKTIPQCESMSSQVEVLHSKFRIKAETLTAKYTFK